MLNLRQNQNKKLKNSIKMLLMKKTFMIKCKQRIKKIKNQIDQIKAKTVNIQTIRKIEIKRIKKH